MTRPQAWGLVVAAVTALTLALIARQRGIAGFRAACGATRAGDGLLEVATRLGAAGGRYYPTGAEHHWLRVRWFSLRYGLCEVTPDDAGRVLSARYRDVWDVL